MGCKINVSRVVRCPNISCFSEAAEAAAPLPLPLAPVAIPLARYPRLTPKNLSSLFPPSLMPPRPSYTHQPRTSRYCLLSYSFFPLLAGFSFGIHRRMPRRARQLLTAADSTPLHAASVAAAMAWLFSLRMPRWRGRLARTVGPRQVHSCIFLTDAAKSLTFPRRLYGPCLRAHYRLLACVRCVRSHAVLRLSNPLLLLDKFPNAANCPLFPRRVYR